MSKINRAIILIVALCALASSAFAVDEELVNRYLNAANEQYTAKNNAKAFSYINIVLNSYKQEMLPQNVEVIAETIYYAYLVQIKDARDSSAFAEVKEKLIEFPFLSSERINRQIKIINTYEAQDIAWGSDPTRGGAVSSGDIPSNNPVLHNTLQLQLELENARREAAQEEEARQAAIRKELAETQKDAFETGIKQAAEATGKTGRAFLVILVVLSVICLIVFGVVIANLMVNLKSSKTQNERFMETLKVVSQLSNNIANKPSLTALPPLYEAASDVRMIGSGTAATGLPPEPVTEADKKEFADLAQACRDIGQKIDLATSRKNNSKNVAEICYKIAMEMGYGQYEASLFFSVGLVYDLGFLEIDSSLLSLKELTDQQKFEIRNHVKQGLAQLDFVPERYVSVFADGVLMHHENIDGSGYPEGLSGERIPYIARLLRVAESFVALISRRNYREITDKESAVADLRSKPAFYDQSIVDVLERLI